MTERETATGVLAAVILLPVGWGAWLLFCPRRMMPHLRLHCKKSDEELSDGDITTGRAAGGTLLALVVIGLGVAWYFAQHPTLLVPPPAQPSSVTHHTQVLSPDAETAIRESYRKLYGPRPKSSDAATGAPLPTVTP